MPIAMFDRQFPGELGETRQPVARPSFDSPSSIIQVPAVSDTAAGLVQLVAAKEMSNNFQWVTAVLEILTPMKTKANPNTHNRKNYTKRNYFHTENEREVTDMRLNTKNLGKISFNCILYYTIVCTNLRIGTFRENAVKKFKHLVH